MSRINGIISDDDSVLINGYISKGGHKVFTTFKVDTGFTKFDLGIPADIASMLNLNPSRIIYASTPLGNSRRR